jgi:hypothetical protein
MLNENACVIFKNEVKIEHELMSKRNPLYIYIYNDSNRMKQKT